MTWTEENLVDQKYKDIARNLCDYDWLYEYTLVMSDYQPLGERMNHNIQSQVEALLERRDIQEISDEYCAFADRIRRELARGKDPVALSAEIETPEGYTIELSEDDIKDPLHKLSSFLGWTIGGVLQHESGEVNNAIIDRIIKRDEQG